MLSGGSGSEGAPNFEITGMSSSGTMVHTMPHMMVSTPPPMMAAATSWQAVIATTMGMYIALQNIMPSWALVDSLFSFKSLLETRISANMAKPTPPTLDPTPVIMPRMSPSSMPPKKHPESKANP